MQWKIAKELANSEGIEWIRRELAGFDWSMCEWITVRQGAWGEPDTQCDEAAGRCTNPIAGVCQYLGGTKSGTYRLNCRVNTRHSWPTHMVTRVSPLYRNTDGTWPPVPAEHKVGRWYRDERTGREWKRLYYMLPLNDIDEALVLIIAHEAFHFLRRTRQIPGTNKEIDADAYAMSKLQKFREWRDKYPRKQTRYKPTTEEANAYIHRLVFGEDEEYWRLLQLATRKDNRKLPSASSPSFFTQ